MASGTPLTDEDRFPWLERVRAAIDETLENITAPTCIAACSALRKIYRDVIRHARARVCFIYLRANPEYLGVRISERDGHFMPRQLLDSQLNTLEQPGKTEHDVITVDSGKSTDIELIARLVMSVYNEEHDKSFATYVPGCTAPYGMAGVNECFGSPLCGPVFTPARDIVCMYACCAA